MSGWEFSFLQLVLWVLIISVIIWAYGYFRYRKGRNLAMELREEITYNLEQLTQLKKQLEERQTPSVHFKNRVYQMTGMDTLCSVLSLDMLKNLMDLYSEFETIHTAIGNYEKTQVKQAPLFGEEEISKLQDRILHFQGLLSEI